MSSLWKLSEKKCVLHSLYTWFYIYSSDQWESASSSINTNSLKQLLLLVQQNYTYLYIPSKLEQEEIYTSTSNNLEIAWRWDEGERSIVNISANCREELTWDEKMKLFWNWSCTRLQSISRYFVHSWKIRFAEI